MTTELALPAFEVKNELRLPWLSTPVLETKLFNEDRQLLISKTEVVILKGSTIYKKLTFNEEVVTAMFTAFPSATPDSSTKSTDSIRSESSLVVCLKKAAHIYYPDSRVYVVGLPFTLKSAYPVEAGVLLERDQNNQMSGSPYPQQLNSSTLLTLVGPTGEFRVVTTSSTSVISRHESLLYFPKRGYKSGSLCATFNSQETSVTVYHIRAATRNNKRLNSNPKYKRKQSLAYTPNHSRILEDDIMEMSNLYSGTNQSGSQGFSGFPGNHGQNSNFQVSGSSTHNNYAAPGSNSTHIHSVNMEKKRTSTLLSDISSIARMSTDPGFDTKKTEYPALKKEMILTRVDAHLVHVHDALQIKVFGLTYEDQEAMVVFDKVRNVCRVYIYNPSVSSSQSSYSISCTDCEYLFHSRFNGLLVVLRNNGLYLVNPFLDIISPRVNIQYTVSKIVGCYESHVSLEDKEGAVHSLVLVLEPMNDFVRRCLSSFKYLSGSKINETVWMLWRAAFMLDETNDEWNAFVIALLSIVFPFDNESENSTNSNCRLGKLLAHARILHEAYSINYSLSDLIPYITLSLHILREDLRLDSTARLQLDQMAELLVQIATWMGWPETWTQYYCVDASVIDNRVLFLSTVVLEYPPNLLEALASLFTENISQYVTFSQLVEESDSVDLLITPRTYHVLKLFEVIVSPHYGPNAVIDMLCEYNITQGDLDTYPPGVWFPLKEIILVCQENPAFEWTSKALELVGRRDLSLFLSDEPFKTHESVEEVHTRLIGEVLSNIIDHNESISPWDGQSEADRIGITKLIFDTDRRYYEITTLLHQTRTQTATLTDVPEDISEYDLVVLQRELASLVALRTLTIPLGRAALFYSSRRPLLTEKFPIPKFNLNTLIGPTLTNIILSEGALNANLHEWGSFHNGVSLGLSIDRAAQGISGSWIIFNKPQELNAQHAGFLMGLGLNGHLKRLEEWHIYNYLGPKHPLTSVGLLIGMAASARGSMDNKLTKVLSVHAVALLPQGANDLNVLVMVQTAGLIGIGLLYLESQHRRMSEILLMQLTLVVYQSDCAQIHEGYRVAAGIALGFVNLGKGDDLRGLHDTPLIDKLLSLATSMKDFQPVQELDKSCCGAILALGFIYMRTKNAAIAAKLKVPELEQLLDYVRPDLLFLRCVAKNLIMWDQIGKSVEWVELEIPSSVLNKYCNCHRLDSPLDSDQLAFFNILGGTCMSIAIKYALSHDEQAKRTLLRYLDMIMAVSAKPASNYDQRIARHSAINIQNSLALSLAVVMAGSGDLDTFRRLRILHYNTGKDIGYGNYMAINLALGFLFLSGGQYAFGSSNFAIACLVTSMYPISPNGNSDHEVHLQALRHLWALLVEPRCLVVRDVSTGKPCKVPVLMHLTDGSVRETLAPCLMPPLDMLLSITTMSSDHFTVNIDFELHSEYLDVFKKSLTLFVYRKKNYEALRSSVGVLLSNENKALQIANGEIDVGRDLQQVILMEVFGADSHEQRLLLLENATKRDGEGDTTTSSVDEIVDDRLELRAIARNPRNVEDLWNLRLVFGYADRVLGENLHYIGVDFVERMKQLVFSLSVE